MFVRATRRATGPDERWWALACHASLVLILELEGTLVEPGELTLGLDAILILNHLIRVGVRVVVMSGLPATSVEEMSDLVPGAWWVADRRPHRGSIVRRARDHVTGSRIIAIGSHLPSDELAPVDASVRVGSHELASDAVAADVGAVHAFLRWIAEARRGNDTPIPIQTAVARPR